MSGPARSGTLCGLLAALGAGLLLLAGCEEDISAVRNIDQPFSLYGVITPQSDTQRVRIYAVEKRLEVLPAEPLDAQLVSTDLQTGTQHVWRDSLIQESGGQYAHVLWAPFRAEYGHTYHLVATRSDGAMSTVEVPVPPRARVLWQDGYSVIGSKVLIPAFVQGDVHNLVKVEERYVVGWLIGFGPTGDPIFDFTRFSLPYAGQVTETADGLLLQIDLAAAYPVAVRHVPTAFQPNIPTWGVRLALFTLAVDVGNEEWVFPGGVYDSTALAQPGTFTNVQGGFGFVGGGYRVTTSWVPEIEAIKAARFASPQG